MGCENVASVRCALWRGGGGYDKGDIKRNRHACSLRQQEEFMVDYTVTATSVQASASATVIHGTAGATITAGQAVYRDATDGEWKLLDVDTASGAGIGTQGNMGIALNGAADGQPLSVCVEDPDFTPGITMVVGTTVVGSGTAGGLAPDSDLAAGDYHVVLIVPKTTTVGYLCPIRSTGDIQA